MIIRLRFYYYDSGITILKLYYDFNALSITARLSLLDCCSIARTVTLWLLRLLRLRCWLIRSACKGLKGQHCHRCESRSTRSVSSYLAHHDNSKSQTLKWPKSQNFRRLPANPCPHQVSWIPSKGQRASKISNSQKKSSNFRCSKAKVPQHPNASRRPTSNSP